jgi:hypothetical protein
MQLLPVIMTVRFEIGSIKSVRARFFLTESICLLMRIPHAFHNKIRLVNRRKLVLLLYLVGIFVAQDKEKIFS